MGLFKKLMRKQENRIKEKNKNSYLNELEEKYNVDFSGYIDREELGTYKVNGCNYEASYDMPEIIENLKITEQDNLIDIGCGKGYAMHYFSQLPFNLIYGIEYSEKLVSIARNNLNKIHNNDNRFSVIQMDACEFKEYDDFNYIYMYNPLDVNGIKCVVNNLRVSIERKPRNIYIIYQNPRFWEEFTVNGLFERVVEADMCLIMKHVK